MTDRRIYEPIKHNFSQDEVRQLGEALARESQVMIDLREQKANAVAGFAAQLKAGGIRVQDLTTKINNGYEVRDVECMYIFDQPKMGMKTLVRCEDSTEVRMEAMTLEEQQRSFDFPEEGIEVMWAVVAVAFLVLILDVASEIRRRRKREEMRHITGVRPWWGQR